MSPSQLAGNDFLMANAYIRESVENNLEPLA